MQEENTPRKKPEYIGERFKTKVRGAIHYECNILQFPNQKHFCLVLTKQEHRGAYTKPTNFYCSESWFKDLFSKETGIVLKCLRGFKFKQK